MNKGQKYTQEFPTIYYRTFGNKDNPCIILIMGLGGQIIHWPKELIQGLSKPSINTTSIELYKLGVP